MTPQALPLLENLIALLGEETTIYATLAELLVAEQAALLAVDAAELAELASRKETLALRLKALDESRRLIARRLATLLGVPADAVTITRLCGVVGGLDAERLARAADKLKSLVTHCQELNNANSFAARKGLELAQGAIQYLLTPPDPAGKVYAPPRGNARGYAAAGRAALAPGLISRQV